MRPWRCKASGKQRMPLRPLGFGQRAQRFMHAAAFEAAGSRRPKARFIAGLADSFRSGLKRLAQLLQLLEQTLTGDQDLVITALLVARHWSPPILTSRRLPGPLTSRCDLDHRRHSNVR